MRKQNQSSFLAAEYWLYSQKHRIHEAKKELPLCVLVLTRFSSRPHNRFMDLLESINGQNYSNYRVVFVEDENNRKSEAKYATLRKMIGQNFHRLAQGRVRSIVLNEDRLGLSGNLHIRGSQFCGRDEIVVGLRPDHLLYGRQAFQVINSAFQD